MPHLTGSVLCRSRNLTLTRVACDGDDGTGPRDESVEDDLVIIPLRGRFVFRDRSARLVISPLKALLLRAGETYAIQHPHGDGDVCLSVRGDLCAPLAARRERTLDLSAAGWVRVHRLLGRFGPHRHPEPLGAEEELYEALWPDGQDARPAAARDRVVADAIAYTIELRFDEGIGLRDLAAAAGVDVFYACRAFRRVMNTSIHRYRQAVRLRHALSLLLDTTWPAARIAVESGFANQGHLGNVFRRRYGVTPARVRRDF